jgi:phosphonate ABC transporter permease subunit PhnE
LGKIRTDGQGHFQNQLRIPSVDVSEQPHVVEMQAVWSVGWPRPSAALQITAERMIETIFLALMATTLAIFVAIPISFVAAYNLMRSVETPLGGVLAALLPFPIGWVLGRQLFASLAVLGRDLGGMGWLGLLPAVGGLVPLYLLVVLAVPWLDRIENRWLAGAVRYVRMTLVILIGLFLAGTLSGLGAQLSQALSGFLAGILSSIIGTLADLLGILLPVLAGLGGAWVLGSIVGTLLDGLLDRVDNALVQRSLGLVLGAGAGALLVFGIYRGVFHFYNPGEPVPYLLEATIGGAVLAGLLGLLARADYALPIGMIAYYITRTILNALRSVEPLIMAIVFVIWVGIGPFAGVLALTLHSIAALSKLYSEQVESIDAGPLEAIQATGATRLQTIIYGVVPQIVPPYLAFTLYRWDINVRMSTIIGFVGGGGIGQVLKQWIDLLQYQQAGVATLAITLVVAALDYVSAQARERIT